MPCLCVGASDGLAFMVIQSGICVLRHLMRGILCHGLIMDFEWFVLQDMMLSGALRYLLIIQNFLRVEPALLKCYSVD